MPWGNKKPLDYQGVLEVAVVIALRLTRPKDRGSFAQGNAGKRVVRKAGLEPKTDVAISEI